MKKNTVRGANDCTSFLTIFSVLHMPDTFTEHFGQAGNFFTWFRIQ